MTRVNSAWNYSRAHSHARIREDSVPAGLANIHSPDWHKRATEYAWSQCHQFGASDLEYARVLGVLSRHREQQLRLAQACGA